VAVLVLADIYIGNIGRQIPLGRGLHVIDIHPEVFL
jgi:hypothetical protein